MLHCFNTAAVASAAAPFVVGVGASAVAAEAILVRRRKKIVLLRLYKSSLSLDSIYTHFSTENASIGTLLSKKHC